ncbi:winged helix-turn-helix domain-containing protein [Actinomadura kijaniata]|uniref:winged helix-turn-helix domain-containing protein n=1 Tax=Actinomadura kijaniata TaxID=46161 RepID=UPI000830F4D5|nr:winged helix-turn-helix domain-containing protein [Actinomadura kijaniata]
MASSSPEPVPFTKAGYVVLFAEDPDAVQSLLRADNTVVVMSRAGGPPGRRPGGPERAPVTVGRLEIRPGERRVLCGGRPLALSRQEIDLLGRLARPAGRASPFREIIRAVWGTPGGVGATVVHSAVLRLRRKLRAADARVDIEWIRGYGLRLVAEDPTGPSR